MPDPKAASAFPSGKLTASRTATFSGIRADILLGGESSPMTVMAMTIEPDHGAPAHISHGEDKVFEIMDGRLLFLIEDQKIHVSRGEQVFVGRGVTHSFSALDGVPARMTLVSTPSKHDRFFAAMDELSFPHDLAEVQAVCQRFDQAIVGPIVDQ